MLASLPDRSQGMSLIELMLGLTIGLVLVAGVIGIFSATVASQGMTLKMTRLNQDLRNVMDIMVRDIRRAGYWSLAQYAAAPIGNLKPDSIATSSTNFTVFDEDGTTAANAFAPFGTGMVGLSVFSEGMHANISSFGSDNQVSVNVTNGFDSDTLNVDFDGNGVNDAIAEGGWSITNPFMTSGADIDTSSSGCVTYSYDRDNASPTPSEKTAVNDDEHFGFRLSNQTVEFFTLPAGSSQTISCAASAASDGWEPITSESINVTSLTFSTSNSACINLSDYSSDCGAGGTTPDSGDVLLQIRDIKISLSAELVSDPSVKRTMEETIRLRNDKVYIY